MNMFPHLPICALLLLLDVSFSLLLLFYLADLRACLCAYSLRQLFLLLAVLVVVVEAAHACVCGSLYGVFFSFALRKQ